MRAEENLVRDMLRQTPPPTAGTILRAVLVEKCWRQADLAWILRASPSTINAICRDRTGISPARAKALEAALHVPAELWLETIWRRKLWMLEAAAQSNMQKVHPARPSRESGEVAG